MENLGSGSVEFRLHGPDVNSSEVDGDIFANKLLLLIRALKSADRALNGHLAHRFVIEKLHSSTPTVRLHEKLIDQQAIPLLGSRSAIRGFANCATAIIEGNREEAFNYGATPVSIKTRG